MHIVVYIMYFQLPVPINKRKDAKRFFPTLKCIVFTTNMQ